MPNSGATLVISGPWRRSKSSKAAPSTLVAMPVANPWINRALINQATLSALMNSNIASMLSNSAAKITGLRPR
ncbi:hypothetical protein D3C81_2084220 [compost metagenome]